MRYLLSFPLLDHTTRRLTIEETMQTTDDQIKEYCKRMNYKLISIGVISFSYIEPDGSMSALLKAATHNQLIGDHDENPDENLSEGEIWQQ